MYKRQTVSCAETAEPVEMPFRVWTRGARPKELVLCADTDPPLKGALLGLHLAMARLAARCRYSEPYLLGEAGTMGLWLPVNCSNLDDDCRLVYSLPVFILYSGHTMHCIHVKKGKVFPYSLPSVGPGADPTVQAVSPQVT